MEILEMFSKIIFILYLPHVPKSGLISRITVSHLLSGRGLVTRLETRVTDLTFLEKKSYFQMGSNLRRIEELLRRLVILAAS